MTTNVQVIGDALRLIGVLHEGQSVSPEQGLNCLRALNQMMEAWTESDVQLGYFAQSTTTDNIPIPAWAEQGVTSKLAQRLQADYPASDSPPWLMDDSRNGIGLILRKCISERLQPADLSHLPVGSGHYGSGFDITRG